MDARLDPQCESAVALVKQHEDQDDLLVGGSGGQLAAIVKTTQEKQITDHLVRCARCRHYDPRCAECGFDVRRERHGWRCARSPTRFSDLFPWNWRAKKAPQANVAWRYVNAPRDVARPGPAPEPAPGPGTARVEAARPVRVETGPKPRARPAARPADSLAVAYAALGVSMDAEPDAVRAAYRSRAQQYHPDKVAHMAPEFRDVAEKKMVEINAAYERIKRSWT